MRTKTRELFLRYTDPKYELIEVPTNGEPLHRVRALRDFGDVMAGDVGGFVHGHHNLSHDGNAWIYDDAAALDNSHVGQDAKLFGTAELRHSSKAMGDAGLHGNIRMTESAQALDEVRITGNVQLAGACTVSGRSMVSGDVSIAEMVHITGDARVEAYDGRLQIRDFVIIRDDAHVVGGPRLDWIRGNHLIGGDARVHSEDDLRRVATPRIFSTMSANI